LVSGAPATVVTTLDGVRLAVHDLGGPTDEKAPVLFFSHATGFHGRVWEPLATHLTDQYRCFAVDYRGHGLTISPAGTTMAWTAMGDDALAVLHSSLIGPDRIVHGVAHSMGGAALVLAAASQPGVFRSLWLYEPVVVPPGMMPPSDGPNPMADGAARRRATFPSFDQAFENFAAKAPLNQLHPDALRAYVNGGFVQQGDGTVRLLCRPEVEAEVYRGAADSGAWEVLPLLDLPVAVVVGQEEAFGPAAFAPSVAAALAHGTLVAHPELAHFGPLEDPTAMANDLRGWVEAIGTRRG